MTMPDTVYLDEETTKLLNIYVAVYNIRNYETAIKKAIDEYYEYIFGDNNEQNEGDR